jgi:hypothetical protein
MSAVRTSAPEDCRLGYEEHDGDRYCFEHGDFLVAGAATRRCPTWHAEFATRPAPDAVPSGEATDDAPTKEA